MKTFKLLITALASLTALSACTLRSQDHRVVRIQLPSASATNASRAASTSTALTATNTCFAINVTGPNIPEDPRLACRGPNEHVGKLGGMVSANGEIELLVPSGPQRKVEVWGFASPGGPCPNIDQLLNFQEAKEKGENPPDTGNFQAYDAPRLLGSSTVDLFEDQTITVRANLASTQELFNTCQGSGGGGNYGEGLIPSAAYRGLILTQAPEGVRAVPPFANSPTVSTSIGAPELSSVGSATSAELSIMGSPIQNDAQLDPRFGLSDYAGAPAARAVVQLQWDLSGVNLSQTPYGRLEIEYRGGTDDSCPNPPENSLGVGVFAGSQSHWIPLSERRKRFNDHWNWTHLPQLPLTLSQLTVLKSGKPTLVVNVESGFAAGSSACKSMVQVAYARLSLMSSPPSNSGTFWGTPYLFAAADRIETTSQGTAYLVQRGQSVSVFAHGGRPPYNFTLTGAAQASIHAQTGRVSTGTTTDENFLVNVTDADNRTSSLRILTAPAGTAVRLGLAPRASDAPCAGRQPYTLTAYTFGNIPVSGNPAMSIELDNYPAYPANEASGEPTFYERNFSYPSGSFETLTCGDTLPVGGTSLAASVPSLPVNYKLGRKGEILLGARHQNGYGWIYGERATTVSFVSSATNTAVLVPPINENTCTPVGFYLSDEFGNFQPTAGGQTVFPQARTGGIGGPSVGTFYSDPGCSAEIASSFNLTSQNSPADVTSIYYRGTSGSMLTVFGSGPFTQKPVDVTLIPSNIPVGLGSTLASPISRGDGTTCHVVDALLLNSSMNPSTGAIGIPVGHSSYLHAWGDGGIQLFSDPACLNALSGELGQNVTRFYLKAMSTGTTKLRIEGKITDGSQSFWLTPSVQNLTVNP